MTLQEPQTTQTPSAIKREDLDMEKWEVSTYQQLFVPDKMLLAWNHRVRIGFDRENQRLIYGWAKITRAPRELLEFFHRNNEGQSA